MYEIFFKHIKDANKEILSSPILVGSH